MGKLLSTVMAIAIIGYLGYRTMYGRTSMGSATEGTPRQRLDNVQNAANRIEKQQNDRAQQDLQKANE
jgi:hypothetical protein